MKTKTVLNESGNCKMQLGSNQKSKHEKRKVKHEPENYPEKRKKIIDFKRNQPKRICKREK